MSKLNFVQSNGELKQLIQGVDFDGITSNWSTKYEVAVAWSGDYIVDVFSGITINGESKLSKQLYTKVFVNGKSLGRKKSFHKWATEPYEFVMKPNETAEIVFEFSTKEMKAELQGVSDSYDFDFGEIEIKKVKTNE
jgi:hypothetical protein